jgi:hypothetical protein
LVFDLLTDVFNLVLLELEVDLVDEQLLLDKATQDVFLVPNFKLGGSPVFQQ